MKATTTANQAAAAATASAFVTAGAPVAVLSAVTALAAAILVLRLRRIFVDQTQEATVCVVCVPRNVRARKITRNRARAHTRLYASTWSYEWTCMHTPASRSERTHNKQLSVTDRPLPSVLRTRRTDLSSSSMFTAPTWSRSEGRRRVEGGKMEEHSNL
jgi:hypothetical protein